MNQIPEFIITKEYGRFVEFCTACKKENYIGLCYGSAGVGKSMAASYFARWNEIIQEFDRRDKDIFDDVCPTMDAKNCDTVIYTPPVNNSPAAMHTEIKELFCKFQVMVTHAIFKNQEIPPDERFKPRIRLLIVDEADRLQPKGLELIRDIYDRKNIAVILIGMPGIDKRLVRFPQLYSRVGFAHVYKPLSKEELTFIIQNHLKLLDATLNSENFSDQEAIVTFARITHGNFRLINRLLKQTIRVMEVNHFTKITKEIIEAARECLVIGNVQ